MTPSDEDDARAFEEAMRGTTPLDPEQRRLRAPPAAAAPGTVPPPEAPRVPRPWAHPAEEDATLADLLTGTGAFAVETVGDGIAARASGIDGRLLRRLRAGEYPINGKLDLHGRVGAEVADAMDKLVAGAQAKSQRCLLVIHGRGNRSAPEGPVVRPAVWQWLTTSRRARAAVMAFASAPQHLGGTGATLILLRKRVPQPG